MISKLFKHFGLKDLAACSLVNKRWNSIYEAFRLHRLVAFDNFKSYKLGRWIHPDRRMDDQELCPLKIFDRLVEKPLLSNLKHLALLDHATEFDTNKLNQLGQLVHLEIINGMPVNLCLPKLKVLVFRSARSKPLSIDCPELNVLVYDEGSNQSLLEIKNPETIKKLVTNMFGPKLARFKGVECLVTREFQEISKATLLSLPRLNELRCNEEIRWYLNESEGTIDGMKQALKGFLDDVELLRSADFKFTFAGFQLTKTMLDQIDFGVQDGSEDECDEYIYMKNYQLLSPDCQLDFIHNVDYTLLMLHAPEQIPDDFFFEKFAGLTSIEASEVRDENHFLRFIKSQRLLKELHLSVLQLSQTFYDQLPVLAPFLGYLALEDPDETEGEDTELRLNFDFIGQFKRLAILRIEREVPFRSMISLVKSICKLGPGSFHFNFNEINFRIKVLSDPKWTLTVLNPSMTFENADEVVSHFEALKSDPSDSELESD